MANTLSDLDLVIHMENDRAVRVVSDSKALLGVRVTVVCGEDAMMYRVTLESEIGEYVARARVGTQLYGLGTAAELASEALLMISRTRYDAPRAALDAIQQVQMQLDQMCADAMALRSTAANDEPPPAAALCETLAPC